MSKAPVARSSEAAHPLRTSGGRGSIEVFPRVVRSIAGHAALDCYGVMGLAARNLREGVATRLRGESAHRGVDLRQVGERLEVDVYVVIEYGVRITEVARNLQEAVAFALQRSLAIEAAAVNVYVQGVHGAAGHE